MKLLKSVLVTGIFCSASFLTFAQGAYVKLGGGYNFGGNGDLEYNKTTSATYGADPNGNATSFIVKYERVNTSLGKGMVYGGALGYMFNKNIGLEVGINHLSGKESELKESFMESPARGNNYTNVQKLSSEMLLLQPSLVLAAEIGISKPYARFGMIAAKGTVYEERTVDQELVQTIYEGTYYDGWAIGMQGGLGVEFKIYNHFSIFGEGTMTSLKYSPERAKLSKATYNGIDMLPSLTTRGKEVEYTYEYEVNHTIPPSESSPLKQPKFSMPFGAIGFGLGLKYSL